MKIPIDIVWISSDCTVVDTDSSVPPPAESTPAYALPRYESAVPARYVLELNAGEIEARKINTGDSVRFKGLEDKNISACK